MEASQAIAPQPSTGSGAGILVAGFGTTVAMWAVGYVGRLPALMLPSPLVLLLLLTCLVGGGVLLGRYGNLGWLAGSLAGLVAGLLNLLILGSILSASGTDGRVPSAAIWLPGSILVAAALVGVGAGVGRSWFPGRGSEPDWNAAFVRVTICAALLLLAVGGLVTSADAGLAVVDWPNSFGYNMFLYPLSRMTGGIYYEHAHRLFGALVGLTTLTLALLLQRREPRAWVRRLGWFAVAMVIVQGVLGGLRVTGGFTLSTSEEVMRPSLALAMIHGVFGQVFFASLVALGAFTSRGWVEERELVTVPAPRTDRRVALLLLLLLGCQLTLGAAQRHFTQLLVAHIVLGLGLVAPLAVHVGFRAWGKYERSRLLQGLGLVLVGAVTVQVLLGIVAWAATGVLDRRVVGTGFEIVVATAHQWFGAVLLGSAVLVTCWIFRLVRGPD